MTPAERSKEKQVQMSDADWEINKDCVLKKRDHKWAWKHDEVTGLPSPTIGRCVHCGIETNLSRKGSLGDGNDQM